MDEGGGTEEGGDTDERGGTDQAGGLNKGVGEQGAAQTRRAAWTMGRHNLTNGDVRQ